jgi:RND family efflux transporter MFP subunit
MHVFAQTWAAVSLAALQTVAIAAEPYITQGITEPICDVVLSPPVPGIVNAWKFKEGDFVKQNDVLIDLDKNIEELEEARRKYVVEDRKSDLEALRRLVEKSSISVKKEELEKAETEYRIAVAEHGIATEQLRRRQITTPCAGFIADFYRDPGESCQAYQPLVRVVDTRECYFVSNVEAKAAARLKQNQEVKLEIEAGSGPIAFNGKVTFLSPVVDPASGLMEVKVLFANPEHKIRPGVAGRLFIP